MNMDSARNFSTTQYGWWRGLLLVVKTKVPKKKERLKSVISQSWKINRPKSVSYKERREEQG